MWRREGVEEGVDDGCDEAHTVDVFKYRYSPHTLTHPSLTPSLE